MLDELRVEELLDGFHRAPGVETTIEFPGGIGMWSQGSVVESGLGISRVIRF